MRLGDYTFSWDPDTITPIDSHKPFGKVATYEGTAVFQWDPIIQGVEIELRWDIMEEAQYYALRRKYVSDSIVEFNPDIHGASYNVIVASLTGRYIKTVKNQQPYRQNVRMRLNIVTKASTTSTSTTTTTTTTA